MRAHSARLSLLEEADHKRRFHWRVIVGAWEHNLNGGIPRDFGSCGTVLDRNAPLICTRPEQDFARGARSPAGQEPRFRDRGTVALRRLRPVGAEGFSVQKPGPTARKGLAFGSKRSVCMDIPAAKALPGRDP